MDTRRWTPAVIAVVVFVVVVAVGWAVVRDGDDDAASATTVGGDGTIGFYDPDAPTTTLPVPDPVATTAADNSVPKVPISQTLSQGMVSDEVKMVQQRLADLAFDPGPIDGDFGDYTKQAVWAFETLVLDTPRAEMTGRVTPELWDRMQESVTIAPLRPELSSTHVEVYLPEQALVVFKENEPVLVAHISSGELEVPDDYTKGKDWCEEVTIDPGETGNEKGTEPIQDGRCGNAVTPGGTYKFFREYIGNRQSALGGMQNPVYFNNGIAIHGAYEVPDHPDSHGCIRVNHHIGEYFYTLIDNKTGNWEHPTGDDIYVWNGVKQPEEYGAQPGRFDSVWKEWREKNSTTTSTSSTSTTSTTVPATTTPPTAAPTTPPQTTSTTTTVAPTTTTVTTSTTAPPASSTVAPDVPASSTSTTVEPAEPTS